MGLLMKFLANFVIAWIITALALVISFGGWHVITKQNLVFFREESFLFGIVFVPTVGALIIGIARAFGWDGKT